MKRIGIAGAGVAGRMAAWRCLQAGHEVTVFESCSSASPEVGVPRAAGWTAAGMLSPIAEMECGGPLVRDLGIRSLGIWQEIDKTLSERLPGHSTPQSPLGLCLNDSLMVCHASDSGSAQRVLRLLDPDPVRLIQLQGHEIAPLAPDLKGSLLAWRLVGEGHLCPPIAMRSLFQAMEQADWRFGQTVQSISAGSITTVDGSTHRFDWVIDTRGVGAASDLPVRGVRGEVIVLSAPGFRLHRPVRLLHPRWRVYVVPRPDNQVVIGATEIESEDRSPISVQSIMELLSAAFSIFPSLAEARILWTDVNLRPATPDNLPLVMTEQGLSRINGLFRHGWLLAPAVVEDALADADLL
jgi:glycine oxidase